MKKIKVLILSLILFICFNTLTNTYAQIINDNFNILESDSFSSLHLEIDDPKDLNHTLTVLNNLAEKYDSTISHRYTKEDDRELSFLYFYAGPIPRYLKQSFHLIEELNFYNDAKYYTTNELDSFENSIYVDSFKRKKMMINSVGKYTPTYTHIMPLQMMNDYYREIEDYTLQHGQYNSFILEFNLNSSNQTSLSDMAAEIKSQLQFVEINHHSSTPQHHDEFLQINRKIVGLLTLTLVSITLLSYQGVSKRLGIMGLLGRPIKEQIKILLPLSFVTIPFLLPLVFTIYHAINYWDNPKILVQLITVLCFLVIDGVIALIIASLLAFFLVKSTSIIATIKGKQTIPWFSSINLLLIISTMLFLLPNIILSTQSVVDEVQTLHKLDRLFIKKLQNPISITYSADFASDFEFYSLNEDQNIKLYNFLEEKGAIYYQQDTILDLENHDNIEFNTLDFIFINNTIVVNHQYIHDLHPELSQYLKPGRYTTFVDQQYQDQLEDSQYSNCSENLLCDLVWVDNFKPINLNFSKDQYHANVALTVISHSTNLNAQTQHIVPRSVKPMNGNMFFQKDILPELYEQLDTMDVTNLPRTLTIEKIRDDVITHLNYSLKEIGFELILFTVLISSLSLQYIKSFFNDNAKEIAIHNLLGKPKSTIYWPIALKLALKFLFVSAILISPFRNYFINEHSVGLPYSLPILLIAMILILIYEISLVFVYDHKANRAIVEDLKEGNS